MKLFVSFLMKLSWVVACKNLGCCGGDFEDFCIFFLFLWSYGAFFFLDSLWGFGDYGAFGGTVVSFSWWALLWNWRRISFEKVVVKLLRGCVMKLLLKLLEGFLLSKTLLNSPVESPNVRGHFLPHYVSRFDWAFSLTQVLVWGSWVRYSYHHGIG